AASRATPVAIGGSRTTISGLRLACVDGSCYAGALNRRSLMLLTFNGFRFRWIAILALCAVAMGARGSALAASGAVHFSNSSAKSSACKVNNLEHLYVTVASVWAHTGPVIAGWHMIAQPSPPIQ